jgi:ribonuclease E
VCDKINNFIKQNFTEDIKYFENKNKIKIEFVDDNTLIIPDHTIEFQNKSKKTIEKIESLSKLQNLKTLNGNLENIKIDQKKNKFKKKKFYKKKFYKKKTK